MGFRVRWPSYTQTFHHRPYPAINPERSELSAKGRVVLITGAGSGIGQATAVAFAKAGAKCIVLSGRRARTLEETKAKIAAVTTTTQVLIQAMEVSSEESVNATFAVVHSECGTIDVLVHGASHLSEAGKLHESTHKNFCDSIDVNIKSAFILNHAFINQPHFEDRERALIMMNSSLAYVDAPSQQTAPASYAISKLGQAKLIEYSASENAHNKLYRTYAVMPGVVETEMSDRSVDMAPPGTRQALVWDSPDLPGQFFVWLASPEGACIPSGRYLWANWDVEELKARKEELANNGLALTQTLHGYPFDYVDQSDLDKLDPLR